MEKVKLYNMCRILDEKTNKVLVQERIKDWGGIAFPGGKVETGESIVGSTIREIKEETGLNITDLRICGIKNWYHKEKEERHLIILFSTSSFSGELLEISGEGKNYWIEEEAIKGLKTADDFDKLLDVYNNDKLNEMTYVEDNGSWRLDLL